MSVDAQESSIADRPLLEEDNIALIWEHGIIHWEPEYVQQTYEWLGVIQGVESSHRYERYSPEAAVVTP